MRLKHLLSTCLLMMASTQPFAMDLEINGDTCRFNAITRSYFDNRPPCHFGQYETP